MKYAYIENGKIKEIVQSPPRQLFSAAYAEKFIEVPDDVQQGWTKAGSVLVAPAAVEVEAPKVIPREQALTGLALAEWIAKTFPLADYQLEELFMAGKK